MEAGGRRSRTGRRTEGPIRPPFASPRDGRPRLQARRGGDASVPDLPEFQERYGYPKLTEAIKILGLNSARLNGVYPITTRCEFTIWMMGEAQESRVGAGPMRDVTAIS